MQRPTDHTAIDRLVALLLATTLLFSPFVVHLHAHDEGEHTDATITIVDDGIDRAATDDHTADDTHLCLLCSLQPTAALAPLAQMSIDHLDRSVNLAVGRHDHPTSRTLLLDRSRAPPAQSLIG